MFSVFLGEYFSAHWFIAAVAHDIYLMKKNETGEGGEAAEAAENDQTSDRQESVNKHLVEIEMQTHRPKVEEEDWGDGTPR